MLSQVEFIGSYSGDRVWGVRCLLGINTFEEEAEKARSQTALQAQGVWEPGRDLRHVLPGRVSCMGLEWPAFLPPPRSGTKCGLPQEGHGLGQGCCVAEAHWSC